MVRISVYTLHGNTALKHFQVIRLSKLTTPNTTQLTSVCAHSVITSVSSRPTAEAKSFSYTVVDQLCNLIVVFLH